MSTADDTTGTQHEILGIAVDLFLLSTAAAAYEIAPASVSPAIQDSLGLNSSAAGWFVNITYMTAVITSVPVGVILDRFSMRRVVGLAAVAFVVAGSWGWYAATTGAFGWLLTSWVLGGLAYVTFWNTGADVVGNAVPPARRATAVGVLTANAPVRFALGQFGSPLIASAAGRPAILPLYVGAAVIGVVFFAAATRHRIPGVDAPSPDGAALRELFGSLTVWTVCGLCFLAYSLYLFVNTWLPSLLASGFEISLTANGLLTVLFPAIGAVARPTSGVVTDRVFDGRRRRVIASLFAVATPVVVAFAFVSELGYVVGAVVVVGFTIQLVTGLIFSCIAELVAPAVWTTAVSLLTSVGLLDVFAAPIAAGTIIDYAGYVPTFFAAGGVILVGVLLALRAPEPSRV